MQDYGWVANLHLLWGRLWTTHLEQQRSGCSFHHCISDKYVGLSNVILSPPSVLLFSDHSFISAPSMRWSPPSLIPTPRPLSARRLSPPTRRGKKLRQQRRHRWSKYQSRNLLRPRGSMVALELGSKLQALSACSFPAGMLLLCPRR